MVWEKIIEGYLESKKIKPIYPKGNQPFQYSLEGLRMKLKLQYFGHLVRRVNTLEKTLMLGKIEGKRKMSGRGWDGQIVSQIQRTWIGAISRISLVAQMVKRRECLPTPVFLPGEFHGQKSLAVYSPWVRKEWDTSEWLTLSVSLSER